MSSRVDGFTSATFSPNAPFTASSTEASSLASTLSSVFFPVSSRGIKPKSTSPWLRDFKGLPSNSCGRVVQKASIGSASSSTSTPRPCRLELRIGLQPVQAVSH